MPDKTGKDRAHQKNTFGVLNVLITPHPPYRAPSSLPGEGTTRSSVGGIVSSGAASQNMAINGWYFSNTRPAQMLIVTIHTHSQTSKRFPLFIKE